MLVLSVKLLLAPFFIILTYLIQGKFGPRFGGIFMSIPFIVSPILAVIYLQHGSEFLYEAIIGTYSGQIGLLFFILTYSHLAQRFPWQICIFSATSAFLLAVTIFGQLISNLWLGIILWSFLWAILLKNFPFYEKKSQLSPAPNWDLWIRIASALTLIITITQFAQVLGPQLSGAFAMYPIMTSIMSTFNHYRYGTDASVALMHGLTQYLFVTTLFIFPFITLFL